MSQKQVRRSKENVNTFDGPAELNRHRRRGLFLDVLLTRLLLHWWQQNTLGGGQMDKLVISALGVVLCVFPALAVRDAASATEGTVKKIDAITKTIVVKTANGTEHVIHFLDRTAVHGAELSAKGTREVLHGLKEGSEVVVHYTTEGTEDTAEEIDRVGKDGLKVAEGTVKKIDRGAKTVAVTTAEGTEETYRLTDQAARDAGKDIGEGTEKSARITVYYTDEAGRKIAHFFKKSSR